MIRVDYGKCTGCRRCETVCSFFHSGRINRHLARIKVVNLYEIGIDGPVVCQQCRERSCLNCPANALSLGPHGQIVASPTLCTLCGACERNCPIGAIELFHDLVHVCDLCGGNPKCIGACTEHALAWDPAENNRPSLAPLAGDARKLNPSQKRERLLQQRGKEIRAGWMKSDV